MKAGTDRKLKFKKLKKRLGWPEWKVKGLLQAIWDFTGENAVEGDIGRYSDEDIALGIEYEDDDFPAILDLLVDEGWLDEDPAHRLIIHDWYEHCEEFIKKRIKRKQEQRRTTADNGGESLTPMPCQAMPSQAKPVSSCPETEADSGPNGNDEFEGEYQNRLVLVYPCKGKVKHWELKRKQYDEWCELFSDSIDVHLELRKALSWVVNNPSRRKTIRGMPAYLDRWIQKSVNDGKGSRQQKDSMAATKKANEEQARNDAQWEQWQKNAASPDEALKSLAETKAAVRVGKAGK